MLCLHPLRSNALEFNVPIYPLVHVDHATSYCVYCFCVYDTPTFSIAMWAQVTVYIASSVSSYLLIMYTILSAVMLAEVAVYDTLTLRFQYLLLVKLFDLVLRRQIV